MFIDVAIPEGNEEEFISFAKKLGTKGLVFLYDAKDKKSIVAAKKLDSPEFRVLVGSDVKMKEADFVFTHGSRANFESNATDYVFNLESSNKRDKTHYRVSGLNQVLCKLAKENGIVVSFNFNLLLKSNSQAETLGRMMQNADFCLKYKVKLHVASYACKPSELRAWRDLLSFGVVLGMNPAQAKDAVFMEKYK